jgi:nitrite reductase/ring-hydroxylating ferredoxin subunit
MPYVSGYVRVGKVDDFADGVVESIEVDGEDVAVVSWKGRFYAFGNACTHRGIPLSAGWLTQTDEVVCLLHAAVYDINTGRCLDGPTRGESVPSYKVRIEGDDVLIGERTQLPVEEGAIRRYGERWLTE